MENIHLTGLSIAVSTFLVIGLFHPIVIKMEYYFGVRLWWIFLLAGIAFIIGSMLIANVIISSLLGVLGASCLWSIGELFEQKQRVKKGWFPMNPKRKEEYELAVYYKNKQNNKSYVDWLKKSAKLNNSNAKVELAELYLQGVLIDKDEDLAISLLEEELEVNKNARLVLGKYYVNTRDEENIKKGLDLLLSIAGENAKATFSYALNSSSSKFLSISISYFPKILLLTQT